MRLICAAILSLFIISCSKQEEEQLILNQQQDQLTLTDLIGTTSRAVEYEFEDEATSEEYDLLEINSESDSIYLHFAEEGLLIVHVRFNDNTSFYKWRFYEYHYGANNQVYIIKDETLSFKITQASSTRFSFEGQHDLHQLQQNIDIMYAQMNTHPEIVKDLMNIK